jgi:hypothetical protein
MVNWRQILAWQVEPELFETEPKTGDNIRVTENRMELSSIGAASTAGKFGKVEGFTLSQFQILIRIGGELWFFPRVSWRKYLTIIYL